MNEKEYKRIMGLDTVDVGSRAAVIKEVIRRAKAKGYKTAKFHKMPTKQLKAILRTI